jgi:hypothetical protein
MTDLRSAADLVRLIEAAEAAVRLRRDVVGDVAPARRHAAKRERADLNPVRHYAIALTDLESARLRIQEAGRLEDAWSGPIVAADDARPEPA